MINFIINLARKKGACSEIHKISDWRSLVSVFFSPQGMEFCKKNSFPSLDYFISIKEKARKFNVFVQENALVSNSNAAFIGESLSEVYFSNQDRCYKIILMHGAKVKIHLSNYSVLYIENIGGSYEIINDGTSKVLS